MEIEHTPGCPLCGHHGGHPSWFGSISYAGRTFAYLECPSCQSLYCDPMPDRALLAQMYGPAYAASFVADPSVEDPKEPGRVVQWLESLQPGRFIDYGCGDGSLLREAARLGWVALGVELDEDVAKAVAARTGLEVVDERTAAARERPADVLHLGDVVEHLTDLDRQMRAIVRLIKPDGLLLAQGPLEANMTLFTLVLRLNRRRRRNPAQMAPYHVILATAEGQRRLFQRHGLEERAFNLHEVAWPAPARLAARDAARPRALGLFTLRKLSQLVSHLRPNQWGNRYFYAGRRAA